jgi:uncharacterized protein Veg
MKLSVILASLLVLSTSAFAGTSHPRSCSINQNTATLISIQNSINKSIGELVTLRNNTQNKEQIEFYQNQIGILRAEYLKCDFFLEQALLSNK